MSKTVVIDCFPESAARWVHGYAAVAVDVVRATTTAVTAVASKRRCFVVSSRDEAIALAAKLDNPLLVGEIRGVMPKGFDINNSPSVLAARSDIHRPAILLSSSGTQLCLAAQQCVGAFPACLRNYTAVAAYLSQEFKRIAVIGAGTHNEFREEDQMCCAWIADALMGFGYSPKDKPTEELVLRWRGSQPDAWIGGKSAAYLRNSNQLADLEFILDHVDDLRSVFSLQNGEVVMQPSGRAKSAHETALGNV